MPLVAQVAVSGATIHFDKLYSYLVPQGLAKRVHTGSMVLVPFGRGSKARMGVVLAAGEEPGPAARTQHRRKRAFRPSFWPWCTRCARAPSAPITRR